MTNENLVAMLEALFSVSDIKDNYSVYLSIQDALIRMHKVESALSTYEYLIEKGSFGNKSSKV